MGIPLYPCKVVIKPLTEALELSMKKDLLLQRTMVFPADPASSAHADSGDLPPGEIPDSSDANLTGDLPSGEIPEASEANATGDLPSGEMPDAKEEAERKKKMWKWKHVKNKKKNFHKMIPWKHLIMEQKKMKNLKQIQ